MTFQRYDSIPEHTTDLTSTTKLKWSGRITVPAIDVDIELRINKIGRAKVVGYAGDSGYLGVLTVPYDPPAWWIQQNGTPSAARPALAFGAEIGHVVLFTLGRIELSPAVQALCEAGGLDSNPFLERHAAGDWGDLTDYERDMNERSLKSGADLFSSYRVSEAVILWITTKRDRSLTNVSTPAEY